MEKEIVEFGCVPLDVAMQRFSDSLTRKIRPIRDNGSICISCEKLVIALIRSKNIVHNRLYNITKTNKQNRKRRKSRWRNEK